jgi:antitoxin YefM
MTLTGRYLAHAAAALTVLFLAQNPAHADVMSSTYSVAQAQSQLPGLINKAEEGETIGISRRSETVAFLISRDRMEAIVETLELLASPEAGKAIAEHIGWAYGNVSPGTRTFFMIPVPPRSPQERRITVESYVLQSFESP